MIHMLALLQGATASVPISPGLAAIGGGLAAIGAGIGIGLIGGRMSEAIARQPEAGNDIFRSAIILAALVEGVAFMGLIVALINKS